VNRFKTRTSATTAGLAAVALAATVALAGCSAGQVSQTAMQEPAINGAAATVGSIDLRNVHLRVVQKGDFVQPGTDVELLFVAVNLSPSDGDRLLSVSSDVGTVALKGDTKIAPGGSLLVGTPDLQPSALASEGAASAKATVALNKPITNGLTYGFTFTFERAGQKQVEVPISAGEAPGRDPVQDTGNAEGEPGGGH
jgi:hypothetical protein